MRPRNIYGLLRQTILQFLDNGGPLLGAALAFYAILSVAPLVLIVLATIRWVLGDSATHSDLPGQLSVAIDPAAASWVEALVDNMRRSEAGPGAGAIGSLLLLWSATRLFRQMQDALNQLWRIRRDSVSVRESVVTSVQRLAAAVAMVFAVGGTLAVAIVLSSAAAAVRGALGEALPGSHLAYSALTLSLSVSCLGLLFATVYRVLPDAAVSWRDAGVGAGFTAILFCASNYPLSYYLGSQGIESVFGAAGSLVTFLLWVYYAAQLFFLGAQFTAVYADAAGRGVHPVEGARRLPNPDDVPLPQPAAVPHLLEPPHAQVLGAQVATGGVRVPQPPTTARASASSSSGSRL
jgi:membrane protein